MLNMSVLVGIAALAFLWPLLQRWRQLRRQWRLLKHLPGPPPTHWLLGHVPDVTTTVLPMKLASWAKEYGSIYRMRFLHSYCIIATDPAVVRAVLQNSKTYVPKDRWMYRSLEIGTSPALPTIVTASDGEYWKVMRAAWMKCFNTTNLKRVLPVLHDILQRITTQISAEAGAGAGPGAADGENKPALVNVVNITDRITLDVIGHVSYGRDFGAVDHKRSRYLELVHGMLTLMHEEMDHPLLKLIRKIKPDKAKVLLRAEWEATNTSEVMKALADPPGEHTLAGQILAVRDPATGLPLSLDQLKAELVIATLAGFETTSNALSWTLGALAAHPGVLQKLEEELDAAGLLVCPDRPGPVRFEWQTLGKLPYLQAVIREGLRLFSPAANGSFRYCATTDIQLQEGLVLPKGTPVGIPFFAFGHNPAIYGPDVEDFMPERWLGNGSDSNSSSVGRPGLETTGGAEPAGADASAPDESSGAAAATNHSAPAGKPLQDPWTFSIGPRDCAGQALARLELQVVIATVVGRLKMQLAPEVGGWQGLLGRRMYHTTLQVKDGLPMLLTPRHGLV